MFCCFHLFRDEKFVYIFIAWHSHSVAVVVLGLCTGSRLFEQNVINDDEKRIVQKENQHFIMFEFCECVFYEIGLCWVKLLHATQHDGLSFLWYWNSFFEKLFWLSHFSDSFVVRKKKITLWNVIFNGGTDACFLLAVWVRAIMNFHCC